MLLDIDIKQYTLEQYTPAKLAESSLEIVYGDEIRKGLPTDDDTHSQIKCTSLTFPFARSAMTAVPIKEANILVTENVETNAKRIMELVLNTQDIPPFDYQPGDTIGILPRNSDAEVRQLLLALQLQDKANESCRLRIHSNCTKKTAKIPPYIPEITTPLEILRDCLNLHAVLKKQFLRSLAEHCHANEEREFLKCLSSKEASSHYRTLILDKAFSLLDLLEICKTCHPTLELFVEHLPRLLPRPYSIANSPLTQANEIKIIFSILHQRPGVTTNMLNKLGTAVMQQNCKQESTPKVFMYLRERNNFCYTAQDQILIGIGTGLAPFFGFLEHKKQLTKTQHQTWLFAGAANETSILHRDRLLELQAEGVLNRYSESLSRVMDASFHYVQQQLESNACEFVEFLMKPHSIVYICADGAQISKSLEIAIRECLMQQLNLQETKVMEMIKEFRLNGKYREDLWA